jgi:hypothetical protein
LIEQTQMTFIEYDDVGRRNPRVATFTANSSPGLRHNPQVS